MLDYNTKFDRREATTVLDVEEIRELVSSLINSSEIELVSLLTGRLLDLAAMVNFLESEREAPKTFRTAISVIESTIESVSGCYLWDRTLGGGIRNY